MVTNPFSITKANDLSNEEIRDYWVDLSSEGGYKKLIDPRELTPKFILGGKGSGKTHVLRYFSFPLQRVRANGRRIIDVVVEDSYVGIYVRCRGLDASRFSGKAQSNEKWQSTFTYYMDLWLAYHVLDIVRHLIDGSGLNCDGVAHEFSSRVVALFDTDDMEPPKGLNALKRLFRRLQKEIDYAVNNAAISGLLDVTIRVSPGRLVFGIPGILASLFPKLGKVRFLYLIDEIENITEDQQKYVNTLVRERRGMVTFRLGSRTYGIRTHHTLAAEEENRRGSEFEILQLDNHLRVDKQLYREFSKCLIISRLRQGGVIDETVVEDVDFTRYFSADGDAFAGHIDTTFVLKSKGERRYFIDLRRHLTQGLKGGFSYGLLGAEDIDTVIKWLRVPECPILEKINILCLYQAWYRKSDLISSSAKIGNDCKNYRNTRRRGSGYGQKVQHYGIDMYAQLCRQYRQRFRYRGVDTFIKLSDGVPRNLLVLLKTIYKWALFSGDEPFTKAPISPRAQDRGVLEAAGWFFRDAPVGGGLVALNARRSVRRLGELFRELFYSNKPPECSLISFSANIEDPAVERVVGAAEDFSLLVKIPGGQKDRNTGRVDSKYQLNRMLVPLWGLPLARRGAISLSESELDVVFAKEADELFKNKKAIRVARANFPFHLSKGVSGQMADLFSRPSDD